MAEKKKQKPAAFAQEKKTFTGEIPKKANEGKGKKSAAYQPRDADTTSGHDVQRSKNTKKYQKADASGQNVQKSEGAEAGEKSKSDFMQPDSTFTEEAGEEQGRKIASDDYRHRDTYHSSQKNTYEKNRAIKCFDTVKPTLNAAVSDGLLSIQVHDTDSGAKAVYVNGYEFTDLTGGTLNIRLQQFDAGYEYFTISAMDNAGNMSEVYKTKNPYYKDPADTSDGNPAEQLPESATPTKPGSATGTVTEHTKTDSNGNTTSQTSPAEQKKQAMKEAAEAESGKTESTEKSGQGKEFYTIQTATEKVFYLIIDRDGEEEMVYFLTEVTENDLLNATSDNSETLPKNSAALESAIPNGESALPNNNGEQADTEGKETETEKGTEGAESTGNTEETEPEPEVKEAPNPMISYVLIGSLALIVIGAAYYFKVVRKKKEDFIEDEDEDEEDNEEYENEDEESEEDTEEDFFDEQEE